MNIRQHAWHKVAMKLLGNDRWQGVIRVHDIGRYCYTVIALIDHFASWIHDLKRCVDSADIDIALQMGAELIENAAARAQNDDAELTQLMTRYADQSLAAVYERELVVVVEPVLARFSAWYEVFPRSCSEETGRHGTFADCEARLPYIAGMGFDVLYLPPVHPIGLTKRKGPNNSLLARKGDPGSPWAIGSKADGHLSASRAGNAEGVPQSDHPCARAWAGDCHGYSIPLTGLLALLRAAKPVFGEGI